MLLSPSLGPGVKGNYVKLLDRPTQAWWNMAVQLVNTIYHEPSTCKSSDQCDFCATPPLLVICFTQEKWEQALKSKNLENNSSDLVYLDGYNETHAFKLRNADKTKYELYLKQCGLASDQSKLIRLTSLCTPPPGHVAEMSHQAVRLQAEQASYGSTRRGRPPKAVTPTEAQGEQIPIVPKRRGRPPKAGTSAKPQRKTSGTGKRGLRRLVIEDLPPTYKATAESYLKATLAPEGTEIKGHHCITCIHHNRKCKGDSMVLVESGQGDTAWRCPNCASTGRRCYWKEPDKGTDDYDKAFAFYNGKRVPAETREGRAQRASLNLSTEELGEGVSEDTQDDDGRERADDEGDSSASCVDEAVGAGRDVDDQKVQGDVSEKIEDEVDEHGEDDTRWETDDADDELEEDERGPGGGDGGGTGGDGEFQGEEYLNRLAALAASALAGERLNFR